MQISKSKFINYIRCKRYCALDKIHSNYSAAEYEEREKIREYLSNFSNEFEEEKNNEVNEHLETMLPYFSKIEELAARQIKDKFKGELVFSNETSKQKCFKYEHNNHNYICYIDIFQEDENSVNIFEVKATTTKKFLDLGGKSPLFCEDKDKVLILNEYFDSEVLKDEKYLKAKAKLFDKYHKVGRYVYDLAFQAYIILNSSSGTNKKTNYYLATLNSNYIYRGKEIDKNYNYPKDFENNEIITLIDLTQIVKSYKDIFMLDFMRVEGYIKSNDLSRVRIDKKYCQIKDMKKCDYVSYCWDKIPEKNSILMYLHNHHGFKDESNFKYDVTDFINEGKVKMQDIPYELLNRENNKIQRLVIDEKEPYININKIKKGLEQIKYPIYHLDFETFPCPLPRFYGEKSYTQSVFQFSLHIEEKEGICDKEKNHFEFLAPDHKDHREELIKKLIEYIDTSTNGTILVYNQSFEKKRLEELAEIFPEYREELDKMIGMLFDLMYIVKGSENFYKSIGYSGSDIKTINYYHEELSGSYSIKKVLPIFSDLKYSDLNVQNGMEAVIFYANEEKLKNQRSELLKYCQQDTWAMFEVLMGIKKNVIG